MTNKPAFIPPTVQVISDSPISNKVGVTINGQMIPVTHITIDFTMGEFVKLTLETKAHLVDVIALERDTELIITDRRHDPTEPVESTL